MTEKRCRSTRILGVIALSLAAAVGCESEPPLTYAVDPGAKLSFVVKREHRGLRTNTRPGSAYEVEYGIEIEDAADVGDLSLRVTYAALKARRDSNRAPVDFDSSKAAAQDDEISAELRRRMAKPVLVRVQEGFVAKIEGFPEDGEAGAGPRSKSAVRTAGRFAGRRTLRSDLNLILAAPAHGAALRKGRRYERTAAEVLGKSLPPELEGLEFWRREGLAYEYEGDVLVGDVPAAKFVLSSAAPARIREDDRFRLERKITATGTATVSRLDGLVVALDVTMQTETLGKYQERRLRVAHQSKVSVSRTKPRPEPLASLVEARVQPLLDEREVRRERR